MATCTNCGAELTGEFCSQCGTPATGAPRRRGMNPVLKWVLISFGSLLGLMLVAAIIVPLIISFAYSGEAAQVGELETIQTAILSLMVGNDLPSVTASTSGVGGEKIRSTGTQFHATIELARYVDQLVTQYCYRWQRSGRIIFQYDVDEAGNCAISAKQLFP